MNVPMNFSEFRCSTIKWIEFGHDFVTHNCEANAMFIIGLSYNFNEFILYDKSGREKKSTLFLIINVKLFCWWIISVKFIFDLYKSLLIIFQLTWVCIQSMSLELLAFSVCSCNRTYWKYSHKRHYKQSIKKPMNWCFNWHFLFSFSFSL